MRVLVVSDMYARGGRGGAGESVHRQAVALRDRGVQPTVVRLRARLNRGRSRGRWAASKPTTEDGITIVDAPYWNLPVRYAPKITARWVSHAATRAAARHAFEPFDVVHAHRLYPNGTAALDLSERLGVPCVVSALGSDVHTHPRKLPAVAELVREVIQGADCLVAVSRDLAEQMAGIGTPRRPVSVIHNGVDLDRFRPAPDVKGLRRSLGLPEDGVGICFVGRLVTAKGLVELFDAFNSMVTVGTQAWLAVVGDGPLRAELQGQADSMDGEVFLPGALPHESVTRWLQAADVLALPSHNEGLPNVVLEAMACGLPVVATRVGGIPEAVTDGGSGILVPVGDVGGLRDALGSLVLNRAAREQMGRRGRARVEEDFTWSASASSLRRLYAEAMRDSSEPERPGVAG